MGKARPPEAVISVMSKKLRAAYTVIRSELQSRGLHGLDISHGDILFALMNHGPQPMSELSRRIDRDKSTLTSLVAKLERRGFIRRTRDPEDKRSAIIGLTGKGEELKPGFNEISEFVLNRFWNVIPQHDREIFMDILCRIAG
jgi:DNA-binding MarR family transcriptional regulator